jgi:hypothetical protein
MKYRETAQSEIELKLRMSSRDLDRFLNLLAENKVPGFSPVSKIIQKTGLRYYWDTRGDTPDSPDDCALFKSEAVIGQRTQLNAGNGLQLGGAQQTTKHLIEAPVELEEGFACRHEVKSFPLPGLTPDLRLIRNRTTAPLVAPYANRRLEPKFVIPSIRRTFDVESIRKKTRGAIINVAGDVGEACSLDFRDRDAIIAAELELKYKGRKAFALAYDAGRRLRDYALNEFETAIIDPSPSKLHQGMKVYVKNRLRNAA